MVPSLTTNHFVQIHRCLWVGSSALTFAAPRPLPQHEEPRCGGVSRSCWTWHSRRQPSSEVPGPPPPLSPGGPTPPVSHRGQQALCGPVRCGRSLEVCFVFGCNVHALMQIAASPPLLHPLPRREKVGKNKIKKKKKILHFYLPVMDVLLL